jgi:hypothetical protein
MQNFKPKPHFFSFCMMVFVMLNYSWLLGYFNFIFSLLLPNHDTWNPDIFWGKPHDLLIQNMVCTISLKAFIRNSRLSSSHIEYITCSHAYQTHSWATALGVHLSEHKYLLRTPPPWKTSSRSDLLTIEIRICDVVFTLSFCLTFIYDGFVPHI